MFTSNKIMRYLLLPIIIFLLTSCQSIIMRIYGINEINGLNDKGYNKFIKLIPEEIDCLSIIGTGEQFGLATNLTDDENLRHKLYQPIVLLYFKEDSLVTIQYNCAVRSNGFEVDWNWNHDFDYFPPQSALELKNISLNRSSFEGIYQEICDNKTYSVIVFWTNLLPRYAKTALREVLDNIIRFKKTQETKIYLINNDIFFSKKIDSDIIKF